MRAAFALLILVAFTQAASSQFDPRFNVEAPIKRLALVVGNADYLNAEKLPGSRADAKAMAKKLEAVGFKVTLAENVGTPKHCPRWPFAIHV